MPHPAPSVSGLWSDSGPNSPLRHELNPSLSPSDKYLPMNPKSKLRRVAMTGSRGVLGKTFQFTQRQELELQCFPGDVRKIHEIKDWYEKHGPFDAWIHLAAVVPISTVEQEPARAFDTNVGGTINLLETIRTNKLRKPWTFLASTSHVYPSSIDPQDEEAPTFPFSLYGLTKLQAEEWAQVYNTRYELPVCTGRIFNFSSPLQAESHYIPGMVQKLSKAPKNSTVEFSGLHGIRDFLSSEQVCQAIRLLMDREARGLFNIASGQPTKLFDVAHLIRDLIGRRDLTIKTDDDSKHHLANVGKIRSLGFQPDSDLRKIFSEVLQ